MKLSLSLLSLALCLLVVAPASASLSAPQNFSATVGTDDVTFAWDAVGGATKYSIDIEATVIVTFADDSTQTFDVDLSSGATSSPLVTLQSDIIDQVLDALTAQGVDTTTIKSLTLDASAAVKALNPGKGAGRQNNPFSAPDTFTLTADFGDEV